MGARCSHFYAFHSCSLSWRRTVSAACTSGRRRETTTKTRRWWGLSCSSGWSMSGGETGRVVGQRRRERDGQAAVIRRGRGEGGKGEPACIRARALCPAPPRHTTNPHTFHSYLPTLSGPRPGAAAVGPRLGAGGIHHQGVNEGSESVESVWPPVHLSTSLWARCVATSTG